MYKNTQTKTLGFVSLNPGLALNLLWTTGPRGRNFGDVPSHIGILRLAVILLKDSCLKQILLEFLLMAFTFLKT